MFLNRMSSAANHAVQVNPQYRIPIRAISLVTGVMVLLSLINIGSSIALNAILSLSTLALYFSYLIPISLLVMKRLRKESIPFGPWRLGRFGLWINLYAIAFGTFIVIFLPWPSATPVNAASMNYAGPVFGGLCLIALLDWIFRGRHYYSGPTREDTVHVVDAKETTGSVEAESQEGQQGKSQEAERQAENHDVSHAERQEV